MDEGRKERQPACKPGSVWPGLAPRRDGHSSGTPVAGRLEQPTRATRPTDEGPAAPEGAAHRSYSVLLPAGLAVPPTLPPARCALTAPFHPYPCDGTLQPRRMAVCFLWRFPWGRPRRTLSGAASVWSPDFPPLSRRPSGRLAQRAYERGAARVKDKNALAVRVIAPPSSRPPRSSSPCSDTHRRLPNRTLDKSRRCRRNP
jgi:hypothetical protein